MSRLSVHVLRVAGFAGGRRKRIYNVKIIFPLGALQSQ